MLATWSLVAIVTVLATPSWSQNACSYDPCGVNTKCTEHPVSGVAVCRCLAGYDHAPNSNTIEGCPIPISDSSRPGHVRNVPRHTPARRGPSSVLSNRLQPVRGGNFRVDSGDPCRPSPCGENAECSVARQRAVCSCRPGHSGDPYRYCEPDPCDSVQCGTNAECHRQGNRAVCRCLQGYEGDPFVRCDDNPCNQTPSPCAENADCEARGNRAICKCRSGYEGDPFVRCVLDPCLNNPCGINAECEKRGDRAECRCISGYEGDPYRRCNLNPCADDPCGPNSSCEAQGHSARCSCLPGYTGDATSPSGCVLEPCSQGVCGVDAECESRGRSAICRCPRGFSGDPYTRCIQDPCAGEPCGTDAICEPSGSSYTCKCPPNYVGSPYDYCRFDPCAEQPCGPNALCTASGEKAVCECDRGYAGSPYSRSGCRADPCSVANFCGIGAECRNEGNRPVCFCPPGHVGDPYTECVRGECISNSQCEAREACENYRCVDPCLSACGPGADCNVRNHVAICKCPRGFTGDPFQNCRKFTREELCADCGANTDCTIGPEDTPICSCKPNYQGNPLVGCDYECTADRDCDRSEKCDNYQCVAVCDANACGENALCNARNNRAVCTCPPDYLGDGYSRCYTECTKHEDCSSNLACVRFQCKDPCREPDPNVCGRNADCNVRNHKPVCSCPRDHTGDPFVSCRPFTKEDLCRNNPCGTNAECQPGKDRSGADRPVCICPSGYVGDPLIACNRGECERDRDCRDNQGCYDYRCEDPCRRGACGHNADCNARNHAAICTCPSGYVGDPLVACRPTRAGHRVVGSRYKRGLF